jgi:hypothetical protein
MLPTDSPFHFTASTTETFTGSFTFSAPVWSAAGAGHGEPKSAAKDITTARMGLQWRSMR